MSPLFSVPRLLVAVRHCLHGGLAGTLTGEPLHALDELGDPGIPQQPHQSHPLHPHQQRRQDQHQSRFSIQRQLENEINEIKRVNNKQDHNHLNACLSLLIKDKYLRHVYKC